MLLSIIMPIYNTAQYLERSINSVLNQDFTDFELILIDDGSIDNSLEICYAFQNQDKRIRVIHQENKGTGMVRNLGIEESKGKYIGFVDSDDKISKDFYAALIETIEKEQADIVTSNIVEIWDDTKLNAHIRNPEIKIYDNRKEIIMNFLYHGILWGSTCHRIFKKELLNNESFLDSAANDDIYCLAATYLKTNKIVYVNKGFYYYVHRENSNSTSQIYHQNWYDQIKSTNLILDLFKNNGFYDKNAFIFYQLDAYYTLYQKLIFVKGHKQEKKEVRKFLKENYKDVMFNKNRTRKWKIGLTLTLFMPRLFTLAKKEIRKKGIRKKEI